MKYVAIYSACLMFGIASFAFGDDVATQPATAPAATESTTTAATAPSSEPVAIEAGPTTSPMTQTVNPTANSRSSTSTTGPAGRSKTLPKDYAVLTTRSIFMKGRVPPPVVGGGTTPTPTTQTSSGRQERKIVFVGVTETDGTASAMFEDTAAGKIISCKLGDSIASGKVTEITLDRIVYTADGKSVRVMVGQNLDAGDAPDVTARATIVDNGNGAPTTGPTVAPGSSSSGASADDVLERMKAKRRQELGR